jgi:uncharacterized protein (DUF2236 family)
MQFAHPLVARAVAEHSAFRAEAFGGWRRLHRTLGAMLTLTFGEPEAAQRVADRINAIHEHTNGQLPRAEGAFAEGTRYSACDPALLGWVHATLVDSFLRAYELYVRPLCPDERDAYCAESAGIETLLRIPTGSLPRSVAELEAYMTTKLGCDEIRVTDIARELGREILFPPMSAPAWPALVVLRLATIGLLPPTLREGYAFAWDSRRAAAVGASAFVIRSLLPVVPASLRHWPAARAALRQRQAARPWA